jgi:hypothetical protein
MNEEQMVSVGSATDGDDVLEATKLNVEFTSLIRHNLAIVTHASHTLEHGRDNNDNNEAVDSDGVPLSLSTPQMALTSRTAIYLITLLLL